MNVYIIQVSLFEWNSMYFESDGVVQVIFSKVLSMDFQRQQPKQTLLRKRAFSIANYFQWKVAKVCSKSPNVARWRHA